MQVSLHLSLLLIFIPIPGYHLHTVWMKYKHIGNIQSVLAKFHAKIAAVYKCVVVLIFVSNIPMAAYFSLIHQRGSSTVMDELRLVNYNCWVLCYELNSQAIDDYPSPSVLFLTPCHSTPFYRYCMRRGFQTCRFFKLYTWSIMEPGFTFL